MFTQLIATLTLALYCAATPVVVRENLVKLPIARRFNATGSSKLVELDRARAVALKNSVKSKHTSGRFKSAVRAAIGNEPVTNQATIYTAAVQVGNPPTTFDLIVDTGSSNTWVGATTPFAATSTTVDTGEIVFVEYGSGFVLGNQLLDQVSFGGITIPQQGIGSALLSDGFQGVDGIIGIGPTDLTLGTTSDGNEVPTVTDNAFTAGLIGARQVGVSFEPTTSPSITNGELSFGGPDTSKFTGSLHTVPVTTTSPANQFFGVDQSVTLGSTTILPTTAGIVDTGTTLILLASDALAAYQTATGAVLDQTTGLLKITAAQFAALPNLNFNIGGQTFSLTPNAQLWPRALNTAIGGTADDILLIVSDLGTPSGEGLDFIDGFAFLERFYTVFDSDANTVSFATTSFTDATSN
ncbi:aspartic proteinase precursor [Irpex rosettiformis]|uniref:Aspartic proteinase n=1 Tax=Irpex rosettiformis TaxID=378272 RepID=A0ACB8U5R1_9APHY|nr:aspartic proteinase precursor [Irpex rosettiformis]